MAATVRTPKRGQQKFGSYLLPAFTALARGSLGSEREMRVRHELLHSDELKQVCVCVRVRIRVLGFCFDPKSI